MPHQLLLCATVLAIMLALAAVRSLLAGVRKRRWSADVSLGMARVFGADVEIIEVHGASRAAWLIFTDSQVDYLVEREIEITVMVGRAKVGRLSGPEVTEGMYYLGMIEEFLGLDVYSRFSVGQLPDASGRPRKASAARAPVQAAFPGPAGLRGVQAVSRTTARRGRPSSGKHDMIQLSRGDLPLFSAIE